MLSSLVNPKVRRVIAQVPLRQLSPLGRYRATPGRLVVDGDLVLSSPGGDDSEDNTAFVLGPEEPRQVFARADRFFGRSAYAVVVEQESASAMQRELESRGWQQQEAEPALVMAPMPTAPTDAHRLRIQKVDSQADLDTFLSLSHTAQRWIPSLQAAQDADVALFVGYLPEGPIATSRLTRYGDVAEILGVATLPTHRRQGFGTAMTWAAITEAARLGCTALTLNSSALGYGMYLRIGFVLAGHYLTYVQPR